MKHALLIAAIAIALSSVAARGAAQQPGGPERALAVFEEARALIDGGHCDQALAKLRESLAIYPSIGAHLSVADCTEQSAPREAWQHLREAARLAYLNHDDRFTIAESRAGELAKRLPTIRFEFSGDELSLPGLELRLDGARVEPFYYRDGVIATTEGSHLVEASAPDRAWSQRVTTTSAGTTTLRVALRSTTAPPPVAATPAPMVVVRVAPDPGASRRALGFALGGAGVGALVVGSIFGGVALVKRGDMQTVCGGDLSHCTASPQSIDETRGSARASATVATVALTGGAIALAAGIAIVLTSPKRPSSTVGQLLIAPSVGPGSAGMTVVQRW